MNEMRSVHCIPAMSFQPGDSEAVVFPHGIILQCCLSVFDVILLHKIMIMGEVQ